MCALPQGGSERRIILRDPHVAVSNQQQFRELNTTPIWDTAATVTDKHEVTSMYVIF